MTESTALIRRPLTPSAWQMITQLAVTAKESRVLDVKKPQEAMMKMVIAYELDLPMVVALNTIYIIDSKPVLAPKLIWGMIMRHPDFAGYEEELLLDDKDNFFGWKITLHRTMPDGTEGFARQFTLADARTAGLMSKNNWQNYRQNMCYWRAMSHVQDVAFPDILLLVGGHHASFTDVPLSADGDIIEGGWTDVQLPFDPETAMDNFIEEYGAKTVVDGLAASSLDDIKTEADAETIRQYLTALPTNKAD